MLRTMACQQVVKLFIVTALLIIPLVASAQVTPDLIRERSEREWMVKAEKICWHDSPLMRR